MPKPKLSKNIACSSCIHANICKYKDDFVKVVQSIDTLRISISENVEMYCRDLEFLQAIKPICKNYNVATTDISMTLGEHIQGI